MQSALTAQTMTTMLILIVKTRVVLKLKIASPSSLTFSENTNALCQDQLDNDKDLLIDCEDPECANVEFCLPEGENTKDKCSDQVDNDEDNLIDCDDLDCAHIDHCLQPEENTVAFCQDGMDNDGDHFIDCEDPDCSLIVACLPDTEKHIFTLQ